MATEGGKRLIKFGEQRLIRPNIGILERSLFRVLGIADPAHYLHYRYLMRGLDIIDDFKPLCILDAGCGHGDYSFYLARRYPKAFIIGIDLDSEAITRNIEAKKALGLRNLEFRVQSILNVEEASAFDLIICIDVLEHIPENIEAFIRLAKALKPNGYAFYHIPTQRPKPVPFSRYLNGFLQWAHEEHIAEERSAEELVEIALDSGLKIVTTFKTFGYYTGELANSIFMIPYRNTTFNRVLQGLCAPMCRFLCLLDLMKLESVRYAVALLLQNPCGDFSM